MGWLLRARARPRVGPWRVAVVEGSMAPAVESGDWLLVDPTGVRWPRPGSVVVFREPETDLLAIKRVAARGGAHVRVDEGTLHLAPDEAWLLGDASDVSRDSRRYGPVAYERFVGRAWLRYGPVRRAGLIPRSGPRASAAAGAPAPPEDGAAAPEDGTFHEA